ncbi:MAG: phospho-N-acetylmuramoyl-pentapeptide-transferase [Zetaproteobacteria bacterium CG06_land_8_20_14_3_00_59_53]|nr:MAG: phospho-N-acetylmuramoyl-pentapeptide-transferase [Zetaproteobacteria bacterium CG2_30_59_37]PIO89491.1 MAG: phospho-N-acetylmuramoyl-pentapeptide-transferase [Zetaproteobacteria bacterium CG23_combo_of_CG06-09_8_20_14_all_59_86]PIQ65514.1 MAG: phospho-N-acetylmuramoyl-pentapeptide-transferase [Zetaproteobacteria bacterium CG11_big_fil_rev_8_21_14_0_20_59_439]PIU69767.1 MAG: phospho-N-acetylmuramoyl-pentapeptide-transferase [Zetaproteobacteria bacterium CG06_land_8_20_14_3_00_59_53]PIU9
MLFNLLYPLHEQYPIFNLFQYITFRTVYALITALVLCWIMGPGFIRRMKTYQVKGQPIRSDGPSTHLAKAGTPTMGGALILLVLTISTLLWADMGNGFIWLALFVTLGYGLIGWYDDYLKIIRANPKGLAGRWKLFMQVLIGGIAAYLLVQFTSPVVDIPFFKTQWDMGIWYVPFVVLVLVGSSNAVNLTDGLDGLAVAPTFMVAIALAVIVYVTGHATFADYLLIPYVPGAGELTIFCGAMVGACLGFLWFNTYPAQVFMGDVGALALGGALGFVACAVHQQLLLAIAGGLFVLEAVSVMVQVASFKLTGKRVFRMAPIHHHFELKGWAEPKVIVRFWIIAFLLALVALSTLKLR